MSGYMDRIHRVKQHLLGAGLVVACAAALAAIQLESSMKLLCFTVLLLRGSQFAIEAIGELANTREGNYHERRALMYGIMVLVLAAIYFLSKRIVHHEYHALLLVITCMIAIRPATKISDHVLCMWRENRKRRAGQPVAKDFFAQIDGYGPAE